MALPVIKIHISLDLRKKEQAKGKISNRVFFLFQSRSIARIELLRLHPSDTFRSLKRMDIIDLTELTGKISTGC